MFGREKSKIEKLKSQLYSRDSNYSGVRKRRELREVDYGAPSKWEEGDSQRKTSNDMKRIKPVKKRSITTILLVASIIFFVLAAGVSAYLILNEVRIVSSGNIDIEVNGPATIPGGDELALQIAITNRNSIPLELADLIIEYPEGTRSASDLNKALPRIRESIGTIEPGGTVQKTVRAILLGQENSEQDIQITIEYRTEGSNSIFAKEQVYKIILSSSPLSISTQSLEEVISGQQTEFTVTVASNSDTVIENVLLSAEYPFGFEFKSSEPAAFFNNSVWDLGDIQPDGRRTVKIGGAILGEDGDERVFRFFAGLQSEKDENALATAFITAEQSIIIKKPFISVDLALNGDMSKTFVTQSGREIRADITWFNNLPVSISDGEIQVKLSGAPLNRFSVAADQGFYRSIDNTIIWSRETNKDLISLQPGETGRVSFTFASLGLSSGAALQNPEITLDISVSGKRVSDDRVPEEISSTLKRNIKIATDLLLASRAVHFVGPFSNDGAIPPAAEKETTYTVIWTATNSSNAVDDVRISAALPSYVRFMDIVSPANENLTYNPIGGQVLWDIGTMEAGGGTLSGSQREVAFQIAFIPSISQIGDSPILVNEQTITGKDRFTGTEVSGVRNALTTRLSTDPQFPIQGDRVVQ
jgi:hypothetical protein